MGCERSQLKSFRKRATISHPTISILVL